METKINKNELQELKSAIQEKAGQYSDTGDCFSYVEVKTKKNTYYIDSGIIEWDDDGKYQFEKTHSAIFRAVGDEFHTWMSPTGLHVEVFHTRTGSYYSSYYFSTEIGDIGKFKSVLIPEQIIPAHEEVRFVPIDNKNIDL